MEPIDVVQIKLTSRALFPDRGDKFFKIVTQLNNAVHVVDCEGTVSMLFEEDIDRIIWTQSMWRTYCEKKET